MLINKHYHDAKANGSGYCDLGEFFPVWFCAPALMKLISISKKTRQNLKMFVLPFDQPNRIFGELLERVQMLLDLIHGGSRPIWKKKVPDARWSYLEKPPE